MRHWGGFLEKEVPNETGNDGLRDPAHKHNPLGGRPIPRSARRVRSVLMRTAMPRSRVTLLKIEAVPVPNWVPTGGWDRFGPPIRFGN